MRMLAQYGDDASVSGHHLCHTRHLINGSSAGLLAIACLRACAGPRVRKVSALLRVAPYCCCRWRTTFPLHTHVTRTVATVRVEATQHTDPCDY